MSGNGWESNPHRLSRPDTDFEDQEAHRDLTIPTRRIIHLGVFINDLIRKQVRGNSIVRKNFRRESPYTHLSCTNKCFNNFSHFFFPVSCICFPFPAFPLPDSRFPPFQVAVKWYYYEKEAHHTPAPDYILPDLL